MNKTIVFLLSAFALVCNSAALAAPAGSPSPSVIPAPTPNSILVPGGTTIEVSLAEPLSSGNAKLNDQIGIVVKKAVDIGGWVIVAAGSTGHATVTTAEGAGGNGSGGKLALSIDWVYSADGGKIALSTTNHASENGDQKGAASTATLISWIALGPLGFFAHNFVRGKDVTIGTDRVFTAFVDHDVHVVPVQKAQSEGFDH